MALGKKIRELRDELGMSQAQLSAHGGLSQGYLSQLENDEVQNPSAAIIFRPRAGAARRPPRADAGGGLPSTPVNGSEGEFEVSVDPDLLRFLSQLPREQQAHLLKMFRGMDRRQPAAAAASREAGV